MSDIDGGVHLLLEVGESSCVGHRSIVAIELTCLILRALIRVQKMKNWFCLQQLCICKLMQACGCHWTVTMLAYCIVGWKGCVSLLEHYSIGLIKDSIYSRSKRSSPYFSYSSSSDHGFVKSWRGTS